MRERTPSADDIPKRAPPAPSREAASADVIGSETLSDDTVEDYHTAKLPGIPLASGSASSFDRMVASTQSLEDLIVNHTANAAGSNIDHQQQQQLQERYGHAYRSSVQTAQDKRSRLSNVINNLRKKVPDGAVNGNSDSPRKEEDDRNSIERNLETLEKHVMTVLNGVIKDDEEEENKSAEKTKELERQRKDAHEEEKEEEEEKEDPTGTAVKSELSSEDIEAAVVPRLEDSSTTENAEDAESSKTTDYSNTTTEKSLQDSEVRINQESKQSLSRMEEEHLDVEEKESPEDDPNVSRESKESRTLNTIIIDRLSEHQVEERANVDNGRGNRTRDEHVVSGNTEMQTICDELLNDLLSDVYRTIDDHKNQKAEECDKLKKNERTESRGEKTKDSSTKFTSVMGLHCSLPLDKVASVLQSCQASESMTSRLSLESHSSPPSAQKSKSSCIFPPVRLLCLYCDRKFLSMSLRQRHTERAHQLGGGRRSERNLRKPSQNCQYCSEKCADTLESLFQHMVSSHEDKYHACVQCLTRYPTREALVAHIGEMHGGNAERIGQVQPEKIKEGSTPCKEFCSLNVCEKVNMSVRERKSEEKESEDQDDSRQSDSNWTKLIATRESIDNPASPEFDSSFYSNVSCNIRENLLHHLDGKLQTMSGSSSSTCMLSVPTSNSMAMVTTTESKSSQQQPQQSYYEHSVNQIQFPIDISLTAATPAYSKEYSANEEHENSSEYARKAGKTSSGSRPRRVSFEKYNFPRKYDGREQWTCSIKDLSKFDISTQLSLRKKQQLIKERLTINRLHQISLLPCETTDSLRSLCNQEQIESVVETATSNQDNAEADCVIGMSAAILDVVRCNVSESLPSEIKKEATTELPATSMSLSTEFTIEFADFMRLRRREEVDNETTNPQEIVYAELSGEWSRTRIYICGACGSKHITLKEMEDHKASTHPRVLCSHFELVGDQLEHYKHLYLPGRDAPTDAARNASLMEMVCTKCVKSCPSVGELHRHMLECGGDQAWLLGLTGSGKKKCKWRPFGSRSRRRRQRGMKRNIQNSQTQPRVINAERPKEKQTPTGPRVRPSDRESIQKMLANLPAKRATRKILQDSTMRSQGRLRNVQTRTRPHIIGDNSSRISRNKAALRNKLLKNAKSIQRNRCRSDNIAAVIESVVRKCHEAEKKSDNNGDKSIETENEGKKDAKEMNESLSKATGKTLDQNDKTVRRRVIGRPKVLGKRRNVKNPQLQSKSGNKLVKALSKFAKFRSGTLSETKGEGEETSCPKNTPKNAKTTPRAINKDDSGLDDKKSTIPGLKNKNKWAQGILKRKRTVDPVASLNASIKAKSQLRTQDGKFARNPNKCVLVKSSETKTDDGKHKIVNSIEIKSKLKAAHKLKKAEVQLPRRITRLSSDSDKMPTLEPVVQIVSSNEEYADKSANDLPILSPVTSSASFQDQKASRISTKCVLKEKESNVADNIDSEIVPEKKRKEHKSTRGRKPKEKTKEMAKQKKINIVEENKVSKNNIALLKNNKIKCRKNLSVINSNTSEESSKEETSKREMIVKKDFRLKKGEITKETRSNSKTKIDKDSVKLSDIPFEVKKLLGSASKEDLLSTLEFASNDSKRNLRQLTPRLKASDKTFRELDDELNGSKNTNKKEKVEVFRKSSRKNIYKKSDDNAMKKSLKKDLPNNTIANSMQNEKNQQGKRDRTVKTKEVDNSDMESKVDGKQTGGSLGDGKSESSLEITNDNFRKGSGLVGKCRNRNRSVEDKETDNTHMSKEQNSNESVASSEKEVQKKLDKETECEGDKNSDDRLDSVVNINLSHLQSETSNLSIDSGKENSLETSVNIHSKMKVGRPKKTWGARREKSSRKRSLNNVIGILTEGMNIPIEAQQNVQVLTVQTSLDNPDRIGRNGSAQQSSGAEGNVIAVDSAFGEQSVLGKSEKESVENKAVTEMSTDNIDNMHADDENDVRTCPDETQVENAFVDVSLKVTTAKACLPANDIILDLSRRKPKGKGSFLEKIVSKIAKQKDALLEGEVGSLLDTAADELTSILDEVGPTLTDNAENVNSDEVSHVSKNDTDKNVAVTFTDKELPAIVDPKTQALDNNIASVESVSSKRLMDSLESSDNLEKNLATETETQSENQTKVSDVSDVEMKNDDDVGKMNDAMHSAEESYVEPCENTLDKKTVISMEIVNKSSASSIDTSISCSLITMEKENSEKLERKEGITKSRRKSSKRSLENASCSKKHKKRPLKIVENRAEEDNVQKELRLSDIVTFSSKDTSNVGNEFLKNDNSIMETFLNINTEIRKSKSPLHSENEVINNDLKSSNLKENLIKANDESSLEKFTNLPEVTCENVKLIMSLEESLDKIISNKDVITNVQLTELVEKSPDSSILSLKDSTECGKSANKIQKKDQINMIELSSKRTPKKKSQLALSVTSPMDVTTDFLQTSIKSIDETEKILSSSFIAREQYSELINVQLTKLATTSKVSNVLFEKLYSTEIVSEKYKETQNDAKETQDDSSLVNSLKTKKKSLADEHLELSEVQPAKVTLKLNDESSITGCNKQSSDSLENFKIPEVKDLLQNGKKRGPKKKSQPEDDRWNGENIPEEFAEINEISNLVEEKVEEEEVEIEKRVKEKESITKRLERSSSSGSIGLTSFLTKTRSMLKKKIQLSSEDLADSSVRSQGAESTDDLSESSCASESSYFRKKRFAKKKRKEEAVVDDDPRDDISDVDSIALKNDKQNPKRKTSKTKSLLNEHLDLPDADDIDISMDIQASLENTEAFENIEREFELAQKSLCLQNENIDKPIDDVEDKDSHNILERPASNNHDSPDNPITPKKRAAGNFVVVHTKTGEILIVEKKKKLTKEAARFFCDVCATSFTRKSSLKKHTLSQSHLSQLAKSIKDKTEPVNSSILDNAEEYDNKWKNNREIESILENAESHKIRKFLVPNESYIPYAASAESMKSQVDLGNTRQMLEDKLLDEEICKITENMSHDEYVLTDHMTPEEPMLSSMPVKSDQKKKEDSGRGKNIDKKRNKPRKKNLAEEHLTLDSPELEKSKIDSNELSQVTNNAIQISSSFCDLASTKETMETVEKIKDASKKYVDIAETKNQLELIVKASNEEISLKSLCDTKPEQQTELRTTRRTLRKFSKVDNEGKEDTSASTETNRFSLRPRRSKNVQHYEESDVETDVYFMDTSMELNSDEIENSGPQKKQNEVEEKTNMNERTCVDSEDKNPQDAKVTKSKTDSMNNTKKRKRGRPKLKDRIVSNSDIVSAHIKPEINGNDVAMSNVDESKIKDQKLDSRTKECLDEVDKVPQVDANAQFPKRSRGRPRKTLTTIANNFSVQGDNSSVSESMQSNHDQVKEMTDAIESYPKTIIEEITSIRSLVTNTESSPTVQEHALKSNLLEMKENLLKTEETRGTEPSISEDQQTIEPTDDTVLKKDCKNTFVSNITFKKLEIPMSSEISSDTLIDNEKLEDKHNDASVNILTNLTIESSAELSPQITEQVPIDDLKPVKSRVIRLDIENVQELIDVSEEKQTISGKDFLEEKIPETKLLSGSEDNEEKALITNDKSLFIAGSHESQKLIDLKNESTCDERAIRLESSNKKLSRKSMGKKRETDRKRLKTSKGRRKKMKVTELSSDSENEDDRIEFVASSKSKIVKSVFGRVFSGEKTDKVKEVLNDWVSRSEDDSDMSRSASEARSYLRGSTKFPENEHKKEKKKNTERSPKKKGSDKCNNEIHGQAKNRKKREKNVEITPEDRIESPINSTKRRHRESKIRADEKILRTFDDESPTVSDEDNKIKDTSDQINNKLIDKDRETGKHEKELNKEQTKDKNLASENWESLRIDHESHQAHGKLKNSSSHHKKQDVIERSSSPPSLQSNAFKYRRRESKTKAGERIWRGFDNETSSCLFNDQDLNETHEISNEQNESKKPNRSDNSKNVKQKDNDAWKNVSLVVQEQSAIRNGCGKSRKNLNNYKDSNVIKIGKTKTNKKFPRDNDQSSPSRDQKIKNETQNDQTIQSTSESRNRSKILVKDNAYEFHGDLVVSKHMNKEQNTSLAYLDQSTCSKKNKKRIVNKDWKCSVRNLEFDQENQPTEKEIGRKNKEYAISSHSCNLAVERSVMKDQLTDFDGNFQINRKSDEEEEESDNDFRRQRMSPLYTRETPNSSIENSSNEEEEEEEDGEEEEEEEKHMKHEDNSRKTNPNDFSGEKIIIRSPSSDHRSDVVTIAPTDAIEDNALDVPRGVEPTMEPRQGKILNFDEELFVECCSRLKATSENELRGAKKIKLDHTELYHKRDDQSQGFRVNKDRWKDVESQNSLGSLLESVNQLLGEEMYNSHDRSYRMRGSERSSRSTSPDVSRVDNLGYEDSLDVAFEHNNKLRDKIQQRMRESENLIANTFGQKINDNDHPNDNKQNSVGNSYSSSIHEHEQLSMSVVSSREQESSLEHKNKMNPLGGLHKALSNLLHSNGKHDQNGSAPMKLLAELACARAPTSTSPEDTTDSDRNHQSVKMVTAAAAVTTKTPISPKKPTKESAIALTKKLRNPIRELFERKKEINDRKEQERSKAVELNVQKLRKTKKNKKQQQLEFPLIRRSEHYGGLVEKKKRRDSLDRKGESERIKDVYEFDEEESQMALTLGSVMSYRNQVDKSFEINWSRTNIEEDLENSKTNYIIDTKLNAVMINCKFQELEKFAPKTKGALKSFQSEEQQQQQQQRVTELITGPMDEFVERKQQRTKRIVDQAVKQFGKIKKRSKSSKKRVRNAWYENDSSDEFRTAAKTEDVGVGISKSQRSCSKGKQNLFAELSTSSESEYERDDVDYIIANKQHSLKSRKSLKKLFDVDEADNREVNVSEFDNEDQIPSNWDRIIQKNTVKNNHDVAKSESEMSDHSLVIDERKMPDEMKNSDDDVDNQYERTFELDDLYREDSSDVETEVEDNEKSIVEGAKNRVGTQALNKNVTSSTKLTSTNTKDDCAPENELISLEEALDLLDRHENPNPKAENVHAKNNIVNGIMDETSNNGIINEETKSTRLSPIKMRDEKEEADDDVPILPEKLSSNEKPQKESDHNLPLHVFLSRKVQESKKRKQQQLNKLREEQERMLMDFQPTRRQRKCAIGKQGLLAEISSSDEESYMRDNNRKGHDHDKSRKKRESKERRKERYLEKKHEQMIAKEQKAIEEEILREVGKRKEILVQGMDDASNTISKQIQRKKHQKEKHKKSGDENIEENTMYIGQSFLNDSEDNRNKSDHAFSTTKNNTNSHPSISPKRKKLSKSPMKSKKISVAENRKIPSKKSKELVAEKSKKASVGNKDSKERRSSNGKRDSDDEELKTTKSWNKVEEGVGVAISRRKRNAGNQLYYWSSSSDEEEVLEPIPTPEEEEDDRQEQHGWIVGDSHKRMITMLAMEKQLKEKRRRSEDEFEPGKAKGKKHRNSTS